MRPGRAEVVGAGLAGLTAATALAQSGWTVRVHERGDELREIGAGIFMWENALRVLADIGAFDDAIGGGELIGRWNLYDHRRRLIEDGWMQGEAARLYTVLRTDLHRALVDATRRAGATIVTGSRALSATADGQLVLADGDHVRADLIVGADGVNSAVRDSLGLARKVTNLEDGCGRHLIARDETDPVEQALEYWVGGRRVGIVPVSRDQVYVYLCCPAADAAGRAKPVDVRSWIDAFPHLAHTIERIPDSGRWASFSDVVCRSWTAGRVAVVGDAAHAMSPNLGQGACVAMANSQALAYALKRGASVPEALRAWEASERPVTDATQRYSRLYGRVGTRWPRRLLDVRSAVIRAAGHSARWQRRVNVAAHHVSGLVEPQVARADG